jgi:putative permease
MLELLKRWYQRTFADPEVSVLVLFIAFVVIDFILLGAILKPVVVSIVLAYLLDRIVTHLDRLRIPHSLSVLIVFFLFVTSGILAIVLLLPLLWNQVTAFFRELPTMFAKGQLLFQHFSQAYPDIISSNQVQQWFNSLNDSIGSIGQLVLSFSLNSIANAINIIVYMVLVPFLIFFLLMDKRHLIAWAMRYAPKQRGLVSRVWADINLQFAHFIQGRAIQVILGIVVHYAVYVYFGINYPMLLAVLAGASVVIPYVGGIIAAVPILLVGIIQWSLSPILLYFALANMVLSILISYVLEPLLFAGTLSLHPIAIIISTLFFGSLFGIWGVFFAMPLASVVKAILNAWPAPTAESPK